MDMAPAPADGDTLRPFVDALDESQLAALRNSGAEVSEIGRSSAGRALHGITVGDPSLPVVSVVAGAHPDEPAGPVAACELLRTWASQPVATRLRLAVVPLLDVDGCADQAGWLQPWAGAVDLARYLEHRLRREPGADREFAWPGAPWPGTVLPECAAAAEFLDAQGPAVAHLSLHGMAMAFGPWFLLDREALADAQLWRDCEAIAGQLGMPLHDDRRFGAKGFRRCGYGFSTTPSGPAMRRFFLARGERATAAGFGYGSMDSARARARRHHAPPPLCAVSEFPLVLLDHRLAPPRDELRERLHSHVASGDFLAATEFLAGTGARPVPFADQVAGMLDLCHAVFGAAIRRRVERESGTRRAIFARDG